MDTAALHHGLLEYQDRIFELLLLLLLLLLIEYAINPCFAIF